MSIQFIAKSFTLLGAIPRPSCGLWNIAHPAGCILHPANCTLIHLAPSTNTHLLSSFNQISSFIGDCPKGYFFLITFIIFMVSSYISLSKYLANRTNMQREHISSQRHLTELQFKAMRNQLDPHFLFNTLNAIGSAIYQNENDKSYYFLQIFSKLIRVTLEQPDRTYRTLSEEIEFTQNYLALEQFRFDNRFKFSVSYASDVNLATLVPKTILQTFAEAAIRNGLAQKDGKGNLHIRISTLTDSLQIIIKQNGILRDDQCPEPEQNPLNNLDVLAQYIALFNQNNEKQITVQLEDLRDCSGNCQGSVATILIPTHFTYCLNTENP